MKNLRRIFSIILVLSMLLNMAIGVSAAETGMDPDDTVVDTGFKVSDSGTEECICTIRCSEDNINTECPVCGAENADLNDCQAIENNLAILPQTLSDETEVEYTDPNDWIISNNAYYDEENNYFVLTEDEY